MTLEWSQLTKDVKVPIIELLDFESRCNLRQCSKIDRAVVDLTKKFHVGKLSVKEIKSPMDEEKSIIRIDIDNLTIWMIGKGNLTKIERGWNNEVVERWSERREENRHDVAKRFLDEQLSKMIIGSLFIKETLLSPSDNWKLNCDELHLSKLSFDEPEQYHSWIRKTTKPLKKLYIFSYTDSVPMSPEMLQTSESLQLCTFTDITDEQLDSLKANDLFLNSTNLTWQSVRRKLELFLKTAKDTDWMRTTCRIEDGVQMRQLIPEGVEWQEEALPDGVFFFSAKIITNRGKGEKKVWRLNGNGGSGTLEVSIKKYKPRKYKHKLWPFPDEDKRLLRQEIEMQEDLYDLQ